MVFVILVLVCAAALNDTAILQVEPIWVLSTPAILINGAPLVVTLNPATLIASLFGVSLLSWIAIIVKAYVSAEAAAFFTPKAEEKMAALPQELFRRKKTTDTANT